MTMPTSQAQGASRSPSYTHSASPTTPTTPRSTRPSGNVPSTYSLPHAPTTSAARAPIHSPEEPPPLAAPPASNPSTALETHLAQGLKEAQASKARAVAQVVAARVRRNNMNARLQRAKADLQRAKARTKIFACEKTLQARPDEAHKVPEGDNLDRRQRRAERRRPRLRLCLGGRSGPAPGRARAPRRRVSQCRAWRRRRVHQERRRPRGPGGAPREAARRLLRRRRRRRRRLLPPRRASARRRWRASRTRPRRARCGCGRTCTACSRRSSSPAALAVTRPSRRSCGGSWCATGRRAARWPRRGRPTKRAARTRRWGGPEWLTLPPGMWMRRRLKAMSARLALTDHDS